MGKNRHRKGGEYTFTVSLPFAVVYGVESSQLQASLETGHMHSRPYCQQHSDTTVTKGSSQTAFCYTEYKKDQIKSKTDLFHSDD